MASLTEKKCVPCEGGVDKLSVDEVEGRLDEIPGWSISESGQLTRKLKCDDFMEAVAAINRIAELAEAEQHHPDLHLTDYRELTIDVWTHAIGGLSENDLILAAKTNALLDTNG